LLRNSTLEHSDRVGRDHPVTFWRFDYLQLNAAKHTLSEAHPFDEIYFAEGVEEAAFPSPATTRKHKEATKRLPL
jgi:hypothetical protein